MCSLLTAVTDTLRLSHPVDFNSMKTPKLPQLTGTCLCALLCLLTFFCTPLWASGISINLNCENSERTVSFQAERIALRLAPNSTHIEVEHPLQERRASCYWWNSDRQIMVVLGFNTSQPNSNTSLVLWMQATFKEDGGGWDITNLDAMMPKDFVYRWTLREPVLRSIDWMHSAGWRRGRSCSEAEVDLGEDAKLHLTNFSLLFGSSRQPKSYVVFAYGVMSEGGELAWERGSNSTLVSHLHALL